MSSRALPLHTKDGGLDGRSSLMRPRLLMSGFICARLGTCQLIREENLLCKIQTIPWEQSDFLLPCGCTSLFPSPSLLFMKGSSSVHRFTLHSVGRVMMISPSYSELPWLRFLLILAFFATLTIAHPKAAKSAPAGYAPQQEGCPKGQMVRPADGLSPKEKSYIQQRKLRAQKSLAKWLKSVDNKFPECEMPTLAMASSGGGYRAMLLGAGFVQSFDARDSNSSLNGLYQSLSYHAALSGGAWLVSSIQGNGHERVSKLKVDLWDKFLPKNSLWPVNTAAAPEYPAIKADIQSKAKSGFAPTIADPWGRFLSYQLLKGDDGGVATTLSSISNSPSWKRFQNPFLIMTATSVNDITTAQCDPTHDTLQYEFSPYEFGSWVSAR